MQEINRKRLEWMAKAKTGDVPPDELGFVINAWVEPVAEAVKEALEAIREHEQLFDMRWKADQRAIAMWRAAAPGRELKQPDHADMVVWLLSKTSDWQPIETAPIEPWDKAGSFYRFNCLLRGRGHPANPPWVSSGFGYYVKPNGGGNKSRAAQPANILRWKNDIGVCEPTHWMPMPSGEIEGETNA